MKVVVLTSSRADYGIYLPLLKKMKQDPWFDLKIVAFGTHLSKKHGFTLNQIISDGFEVAYKIETVSDTDSPMSISKSIGITITKFAELWSELYKSLDLIICLGDRYEMFAAVASSVPFIIPVAHLHGGETTLGAIDDVLRHSITSMSTIHFASTENHKNRIIQILGHDKHVYNVGALGLDNINELEPLDDKSFFEKFGFKLDKPILITFHPETKNFEQNEHHIDELITVLDGVNSQIVFTMPNADTNNEIVRAKIEAFVRKSKNVIAIESMGTQGYFKCLKECAFVLGNSSSGIIEAASFGKYVINIGDRQLGRDAGKNVLNCKINKDEIKSLIDKVDLLPALSVNNIYGDGHSADKIVDILKKMKNEI